LPLQSDVLHGAWLLLVAKPPRPAPGSTTKARTPARRALIEHDLREWENEFLLAPDEPPPSLRLPLVYAVPSPSSPPRADAIEQDLTAWTDEFLLAADEPPPSVSLPLVFSLPPPCPPPRRDFELPVAA
jgi:hypothetical protein